MNSRRHPDGEQVLADLGDPFIQAFIEAVDGARDDLQTFRAWQPGWFPSFTARFTANFLHERLWARLVAGTAHLAGVKPIDREPVRQLVSGNRYMMRLKRHHPGDRIAAFPTDAAKAFWSNNEPTFEGLESYSLALGYMWDADLRAVGAPVLSFRDGKDHPIWAIRLRREGGTATGFAWDPVLPDLPEIDLSAAVLNVEEERGT